MKVRSSRPFSPRKHHQFLVVYDKENDEKYIEEYKKEPCEFCTKVGSYFILDDRNSLGLCYYHLRKHYGYQNISYDIDENQIVHVASMLYQEELQIISHYILTRGNHLAFNYDELLEELIKNNSYRFALDRDQANKNLEQVISMIECNWSPRKNNSRQSQLKLRHDCQSSTECVQIIDGNIRENQFINLKKLKEQVSLSNKKIHTEGSVNEKPVVKKLKFRIVKCWHCGNPKQKILSYNRTFECDVCKELLWTGEGGYNIKDSDESVEIDDEVTDYFSSADLENDITICELCQHKIDLTKGFWQLEDHMKAKHPDKKWKTEKFIVGNNGVNN